MELLQHVQIVPKSASSALESLSQILTAVAVFVFTTRQDAVGFVHAWSKSLVAINDSCSKVHQLDCLNSKIQKVQNEELAAEAERRSMAVCTMCFGSFHVLTTCPLVLRGFPRSWLDDLILSKCPSAESHLTPAESLNSCNVD